MSKNTKGGVFFGGCTITMPKKNMSIEHLLPRLKEVVKDIGLTFRRFDYEPYDSIKNPQALTLMVYLQESHVILECYPEDGVVEFQIGSCKEVKPIELEKSIKKNLGKISSASEWNYKHNVYGWICGCL